MLKPLGDRVLVEVTQAEEQTVSGFVLASAAKEKPQTGTVVAVGEGRLLDSGDLAPVPVKVGETVLFEKSNSIKSQSEKSFALIDFFKKLVL